MARATHLLLLMLCLLTFAPLAATTIPPNGRFPVGFWDDILSGRDSLRYGDPGWVKRMKARRETRKQIAAGQATLAALDQAQFHLPVLLGRFSDAATIHDTTDFDNLLFSNNGTGSFSEYYAEISHGQFQVTGDVYGWIDVANPQSYYDNGENGLGNFPFSSGGFVFDVVAAADSSVIFSQYDNDGPDGVANSGDDDGYVDGVLVVYPGVAAYQVPDGGQGNLWPVSSSLGSNEYETNDIGFNGSPIKVNAWAIGPELYDPGNGEYRIHPIGVFAHEFGHVLGMPDLYDYTDDTEGPDYSGSAGIGNWCLMAGGSWGGDGGHAESPAHMSAWCKMLLGWVTPVTVEQAGQLTIRQAEYNDNVYRLWADPNRMSSYFLVENRQQTGFDTYLEGSGLMIYHVDELRWWGEDAYSNGANNNDETHKLVDLEEADGFPDMDNSENQGDDGDPWPGSSGNRDFNALSVPSSLDYNGNATGVAIENISDPEPNMTAFFRPAEVQGYGIVYDEQGISGWGWGYASSDTWSGILFTAEEAGRLEALDLGFRSDNNNFTVQVYSSLDNSSFSLTPNGLLAEYSGLIDSSGWHTVQLPEPVELAAGQDFFVSLVIFDQEYSVSYDIQGDYSGRSYTSSDGVNFDDSFTSSSSGGDINIRARIRTVEPAEARPLPSVSVQSLAFGGVAPGKSSNRSFQLYNLGDAALSATLTVSGDAAFSVSPSSASVAPGDSQAVTVTFSPLLDGDYAGSVTITGGESPLTVSLSGSGRVMAVFAGSIGDETFSDSDGGYELWVKLNDVLVNPEVWIVFSLDGGQSFDEYSMCWFDGEKWAGVIPAQPLGTVIPFYFEAIDEGGEIVTLPAAAPDETWTLTVALDKPGDLDGNWNVNIFDLLDLLKGLGKPDDTGLRDIDGNGRVDIFDLLKLLKLMARD